jgi:WXXGXW repeat (2 copies)
MKTKLLALALLAGGSLFARTHVFVGFGIGYPGYYAPAPVYTYYAPPPAPVAYYARPAYPGPAYSWVGGYWYPVRHRYYWRSGYWARRPFVGARWYAPRYRGGYYYSGYWGR